MSRVTDPEPASGGRRVAFLGNKQELLPFKALGIDVYSFEPSKKEELILKLREEDYSIIFISENVYEELKEFAGQEVAKFTPAVVIIPSPEGSQGLGTERIKKIAEKAVGVDLLSEPK